MYCPDFRILNTQARRCIGNSPGRDSQIRSVGQSTQQGRLALWPPTRRARFIAERRQPALKLSVIHDRLQCRVIQFAGVASSILLSRRPKSGGKSGSSGKAECRRSEGHTSELQSLMRISYVVFCLKKKKTQQ